MQAQLIRAMLIINSLRMVLGDYSSTSNFRLGDFRLGDSSGTQFGAGPKRIRRNQQE
jgi:hypothetical protein